MKNVIAAVRTKEDFEKTLLSSVDMIFDLAPDILTLSDRVAAAHNHNKKLYVHMDLASGIGKDKSGLNYVKNAGVDGIISTRVNIIRSARDLGMATVQRFFIVDSQSVETTIESIKVSKPDMIEIMPGVVTKVIYMLNQSLSVPIIAGGLINTLTEAEQAIASGASAISTAKEELWD